MDQKWTMICEPATVLQVRWMAVQFTCQRSRPPGGSGSDCPAGLSLVRRYFSSNGNPTLFFFLTPPLLLIPPLSFALIFPSVLSLPRD